MKEKQLSLPSLASYIGLSPWGGARSERYTNILLLLVCKLKGPLTPEPVE